MRLHTFELQCKQQPRGTVVFLHGFGGSCATYHQFLTELADHFHVIAFDWLGMGCSSKPAFDYIKMNAAQVVDLFVGCLHKWIEALDLRDFHLVGHSLGAYFGSFYVQRFATTIKSFTTVSCAGTTREPADLARLVNVSKLPLKRKAMAWFWKFMNKGYVSGFTAFSCMPLTWIINKWIEGRMDIAGDEKKATVQFMAAMFWDKGFSCDIVTRLFGYLAYAQNPVCHVIPDIERKVPVMHVFGEHDWLDRHAFQRFMKDSSLA